MKKLVVLALASLKPGETVVDLVSGGVLIVFYPFRDWASKTGDIPYFFLDNTRLRFYISKYVELSR